jgi:predicted NUDIX family NTP pyrophosphohydrolase
MITSAGLLMYRTLNEKIEFFLVHPGGPFWVKKNEGAWSIPKGLVETDEDLLTTAQREFSEETGLMATPPFHSLGSVKLKSGKTIHAWAFEGVWNSDHGIQSNHIQIEWPPRSKKFISIPEVDRASWMEFEEACKMINPAQLGLLERARVILSQS